MPLFSSSDTRTRLKATATTANSTAGDTPTTTDRTRTEQRTRGSEPTALPRSAPVLTPGPSGAASISTVAAPSESPGTTGHGPPPPNTTLRTRATQLQRAGQSAIQPAWEANSGIVPPPQPKSALEESSDAIAKARKAAERRRRMAMGVSKGLASRRLDGVPQARGERKSLIGSGY